MIKSKAAQLSPTVSTEAGQVQGAIKESLRVNGQYRPIVVNRRTMEVLAGNHTLLVARELGWGEVAVSFADADAELARRIVLVDNRTNDLAGYDAAGLLELLGELPGLEGTGYDDGAVDQLLLELQGEMLVGEEPEVPAPPAQPRSRVGDLWRLGRHLLLCGDARCGEN